MPILDQELLGKGRKLIYMVCLKTAFLASVLKKYRAFLFLRVENKSTLELALQKGFFILVR